jgi:hypothetical protein
MNVRFFERLALSDQPLISGRWLKADSCLLSGDEAITKGFADGFGFRIDVQLLVD